MQAFMARIDYVCEKVNKVIKKYDTREEIESGAERINDLQKYC